MCCRLIDFVLRVVGWFALVVSLTVRKCLVVANSVSYF